MIIILSPAKTLDFESPRMTRVSSEPDFLVDSKKLVSKLKKLAPYELSSLMGISDKLGDLNYQRYQNWKLPFNHDNSRQAILAFKGDVYTGFNVEQFNSKDLQHAQKHLRILSGLYGLLRPLDLIQPYRLEMGTKWSTDKFKDLYEFWGNKLSAELRQELHRSRTPILINLASNEYFKVLNHDALDTRVITPVFKDYKNGTYRIISFFAKKARGMMAAEIIKQRLKNPEQIKNLKIDGYLFSVRDSSADQWIFKRRKSDQ